MKKHILILALTLLFASNTANAGIRSIIDTDNTAGGTSSDDHFFRTNTKITCRNNGYQRTSCPQGYYPEELCPDNPAMFRECCTDEHIYTREQCIEQNKSPSKDTCKGKHRCL